MLVNLYGNLKFIKAFQKDKDGKQKDEGVSFHMKPTGWFRNGLEHTQVFVNYKLQSPIMLVNLYLESTY